MSFSTLTFDVLFNILEEAARVSPSALFNLIKSSKALHEVYMVHEASLLYAGVRGFIGSNTPRAIAVARQDCVDTESSGVEGTGFVDFQEADANEGDENQESTISSKVSVTKQGFAAAIDMRPEPPSALQARPQDPPGNRDACAFLTRHKLNLGAYLSLARL